MRGSVIFTLPNARPERAFSRMEVRMAEVQAELLSPEEVEREFRIPQTTQASWRCENRFGWARITLKVGRKIFHRRADIEAWLEARRGLAPHEARAEARAA